MHNGENKKIFIQLICLPVLLLLSPVQSCCPVVTQPFWTQWHCIEMRAIIHYFLNIWDYWSYHITQYEDIILFTLLTDYLGLALQALLQH